MGTDTMNPTCPPLCGRRDEHADERCDAGADYFHVAEVDHDDVRNWGACVNVCETIDAGAPTCDEPATVNLWCGPEDITPQEAERIGVALIAAAALCKQWNSQDR